MMLKKAEKIIFLILFLTALICACGQQQEAKPGNIYNVYYINSDETAIAPYEYVTETTDREELIDELLEQLRTGSERLKYKAPLTDKFTLLDYAVNEDQLTLSFDENYAWQEVTTEVLGRAAIVRTLTQIDGISYVAFQIKSEPLVDTYGTVIGNMNADMFIDNAGNEINTYEKVKLTLYLADESGSKLKTVNRSVVYNSNISMEQQVVEELIKGPRQDDIAGYEAGYPTVNPAVTILSVTVRDRVCYVNLSEEFLTPVYDVTSQVALYSIVNSLVELPGVNKVQISIDGNTDVTFRDSVSLTTVFERDLDIIEENE